MAKSDYVFESGEGINVGRDGRTDYLKHSGEAVTNVGNSGFVYESGVQLGGSTWKSVSGPPVSPHRITSLGDSLYLAEEASKAVHRYDVEKDSWSLAFEKESEDDAFAWFSSGSQLYRLKGSRIDDSGSFIDDSSKITKRYSTAGSVTNLSDANFEVDDVNGVVVDGKVLVPSGEVDNSDASNEERSEYYDISSDSWSLTSNIPQPVRNYSTAKSFAEAWIMGGLDAPAESNPQQINNVQVYDFSSDSWSNKEDFPENGVDGACTDTDNNDIYGSYDEKFYIYDSGWFSLQDIPSSAVNALTYNSNLGAIFAIGNGEMYRYLV